jgi:hypothetical protein
MNRTVYVEGVAEEICWVCGLKFICEKLHYDEI